MTYEGLIQILRHQSEDWLEMGEEDTLRNVVVIQIAAALEGLADRLEEMESELEVVRTANKSFCEPRLENHHIKHGVVGGKVVETTEGKIRPRTYAEILESGRKY